ncbi:MAG: hypothetical protein LBI05_05840 [Planctomycetaceae bacterium]|nr:hypothetical protein [Planctomycetaceae bacterium]
MSNTQVKIVMTGPTGVGKTSLLAAMYPLLERHFPSGDYRLVPQENTRKVLDDLRDSLAKLGEGGIEVKDRIITGTLQAQQFNFDLQYTGDDKNETTDVSLQIFDIPGAYCTVDGGTQAQIYLTGSDISFWCIDAVALMEKGGQDNEAINAPNAMADCIRNSQLNTGHNVCLVLMRSEKWEQDSKMDSLFAEFKKQFGAAIAALRSNTNIGRIFYCSIQTTGNLRFSRYDKDGAAVYIRHSGKTYQPEHCELPVLCAVNRSLATAVNEATEAIRKMYIEYPPFFRWIPPWSWAFNQKMEIVIRLSHRLDRVAKDISERLKTEEKNKRLFEW